MSRRTLRCLRCGGTMELLRREFLQLGKTGWVLGDLDNLLAGALDVDILCCSDCGKLEFFRGDLARGMGGGLSTSQWISLTLMLAALAAALLLRGKRLKGAK